MCTVAQDLPEQLLLTSETPGPATELCRRRYRKGGPATQLVHAQGWHPNGGFPDCFTFQAAALLRLLCLPCVSPPSTAVAPHKRCHHDTELHLRLTTTTTTLQSILRPIRPFDFASPYPIPKYTRLHPRATSEVLRRFFFPFGTFRTTHATRQIYCGPCYSLGVTSAFSPCTVLREAITATAMEYRRYSPGACSGTAWSL
jgi:hypothetical protein